MKTPPSDPDEEARVRGIAEQCWLGPLCLLFWVLVILGCIHGCVKGAECKLAWDAPDAAQNVVKWKIYVGLEYTEVSLPFASVTLPVDWVSMIAVVAVNQSGLVSAPAMIEVVPFVPSFPQPGTLTGWVRHENKTVFREKRHCDFARWGYPKFDLP